MAAATTIVQSVALGNRVGISNASYTNCTLVGYNADTNGVHVGATAIGHGTIVNGANSTAIGIGAVANADNALILGATDTKVGVNTSNPAAYFDNKGSAGVKVTDVTAFPYVIAIDDCYINCRPGDGNTSSVTLPLIALNVNIGRMFVITCIDTAGININTSGGQSFGPDAPLVTRAVPGVPHTLTVVACQEGVGDFIWRTYAQ
jgi:hypothetical protein